jgi:succinoglycan biosynthesis protein ExoA
MPVRTECRTLERAVHSIMSQEYPPQCLEVVIAVAPSTDETRAIAERLAASDPRIRIVDNPGATTPIGLNVAIRAVRGELVARLDGHSWLEPGYLRSGVDTLSREGAAGVGGLATHLGQSHVGEAISTAMTSRIGTGNADFRVGGPPRETDSVMFGIYRRDVLEALRVDGGGPFDERLVGAEDDELNHRIRLGGGRLLFVPDMRFNYVTRDSLGGLWRQYRGYGRGRLRTLQKHGRPGAARQLAAPALTVTLMAATAADLLSNGRLRVGRRLVPAYGVGIAVGALAVTARRGRPAQFPLVAAAMATMHLGYGWGFVTEAVRQGAESARAARRPR